MVNVLNLAVIVLDWLEVKVYEWRLKLLTLYFDSHDLKIGIGITSYRMVFGIMGGKRRFWELQFSYKNMRSKFFFFFWRLSTWIVNKFLHTMMQGRKNFVDLAKLFVVLKIVRFSLFEFDVRKNYVKIAKLFVKIVLPIRGHSKS